MPPKLTIFLIIVVWLAFMGIFWMIYKVKSKTSKNGTVVSSRKTCARIGGNILKMNGSAVDAAIATLFCEGLYQPQNLGIGGGFLALVYNKSTSSSEALIALEGVPVNAKEDTFANGSFRDELTIAVPAEVRGYFALHRKYGRLKWADLLTPTIKICETGYKVDKDLAFDLKGKEDNIKKIDSLREIFINPYTGNVYEKDDIIHDPFLAKTLKTIAEQGEAAIYNGGTVGRKLIEDVRSFGGILTEDDLKYYELQWNDSLKTKYYQHTIHSMPLLGSEYLVNLIQRMESDEADDSDFKIFESGHVAPEVAARQAKKRIGYHSHIKFYWFQDVKTFNVLEFFSHSGGNLIHSYAVGSVVVIAPKGDAIAVTSTLHSRFGSMRRSHQTGIILNDHLREPSFRKLRRIDRQRRILPKIAESSHSPFFAMYPTIITDINGYPKMVLSSCGDLNVTYSLAKIVINNLGISSNTRPNFFKVMRRLY